MAYGSVVPFPDVALTQFTVQSECLARRDLQHHHARLDLRVAGDSRRVGEVPDVAARGFYCVTFCAP
jgi:hypothetical protein